MSLAQFASVLFKARMIILYVFAKPKNKFTGNISVYFHFFQDILFLFFKKTVGMLIVIHDPHMQETDLTQFHQLNIQIILLLCFCLYVE